MKYLISILTICSIALLNCSNTAQNTNGLQETIVVDADLQKIVDTFFQKYQSSPSESIDYIFSTNNSFTPNQLNDLKDKLQATINTVGNYNEAELITIKKTSASLVFFSYLVKHDKQPLRFTLMFYKPKANWILYKFKFDDSVDAELEESGRIYFIK